MVGRAKRRQTLVDKAAKSETLNRRSADEFGSGANTASTGRRGRRKAGSRTQKRVTR
jgi:hypothetical protein